MIDETQSLDFGPLQLPQMVIRPGLGDRNTFYFCEVYWFS